MNIRLRLKNRKEEKFNKLENNILDKIKKEFENKNILYVYMTVCDNDLQIEFGEQCCFISMTNEERAEIYNFINISEKSNEYIDLYINCYKKNNLCYNIDDVIEIIQTFSINGEHDSKYQWNIISM
jgi:hypothetical protein